jgi:hypothetical protein
MEQRHDGHDHLRGDFLVNVVVELKLNPLLLSHYFLNKIVDLLLLVHFLTVGTKEVRSESLLIRPFYHGAETFLVLFSPSG